MLRFSDAETTTLEEGFWFLKRGLWQNLEAGCGRWEPRHLRGHLFDWKHSRDRGKGLLPSPGGPEGRSQGEEP